MTSDDRSYFVDANVLVYAAFKDDARHEVSKALLKDADRGVLHLSPQILAEFYSTVTSPKRVTIPYSPAEAIEFIETLLSYEHVVILPISKEVPFGWITLLKATEVRGPHVFDLQIAATMLAHGVMKLSRITERTSKMSPRSKPRNQIPSHPVINYDPESETEFGPCLLAYTSKVTSLSPVHPCVA
jgi:predicted nucleic acid-binding protein